MEANDGKSLAFEMRGSRLVVRLEGGVPTVKLHGETYFVTEAPSVSVNGKRHFVEEIC